MRTHRLARCEAVVACQTGAVAQAYAGDRHQVRGADILRVEARRGTGAECLGAYKTGGDAHRRRCRKAAVIDLVRR